MSAPERGRAAVLLFSLLAGPALMRAQDESLEDARHGASFMLPDETREARALYERASSALARADWNRTSGPAATSNLQALEALQQMLESCRTDLLPPLEVDALAPSLYPLRVGAAEWARATLLSLPEQGRAAYRTRFETDALRALGRATGEATPSALVEVANRWPASAAARQAWVRIGDLELERGDALAALRACEHANRLAAGPEESAALQGRLELARDALGGRGVLAAAAKRSQLAGDPLALSGPGPARAPRESAPAWQFDLPSGPFQSRTGPSEPSNLYCLPLGQRVLVSTSLRLLCLDARRGELLWKSAEPPGWSAWHEDERAGEFFQGLERRFAMIRPACGSGVAVAALQIPYQDLDNRNYQGIKIMVTTPERRLFAFDLESGRPLWSHLPPPSWNGESGSFAERMRVAGPPLIAGSRLLVPCYQMHGRINYNVGCFDLHSGQLLWATSVVSGQGELNMFDRQVREYSAPALCIEGERVIAQTQLGAVAALDLYTGRTLWTATYDQILLPVTRPFQSDRDAQRRTVWRCAPPVVAGGVVVCTPADGPELLGLDLLDGRVLWAQPASRFQSRQTPHAVADVLLGADDGHIWLGGSLIGCWSRPAGLRKSGAFSARWVYPQNPLEGVSPRAFLSEHEVLVPSSAGLMLLERDSGKPLLDRPLPWNRKHVGNLALCAGGLYSLSNSTLSAFLDWTSLIGAAQAAWSNAPGDPSAALEIASLYEQQAQALASSHGRAAALEALEAARAALRGALPSAGARSGELRARLISVLLSHARTCSELGQRELARSRLDEARALAPASASLCEILLLDLDLCSSAEGARALQLLDELAALPPGLETPAATLLAHAHELYAGESEAERLAHEAGAVFPLHLWAGLMRAWHYHRQGRASDELEALQGAVEEAGREDFDSGWRSDLCRHLYARLRDCVSRCGPQAYAPYDQRARVELARLGSAAGENELAELCRVWPLSGAAREAEEILLQRTLERGDLEELARLVRTCQSGSDCPSERDAEFLYALAEAEGRAGNAALRSALLSWLAGQHPGLVPRLTGARLEPLAALARAGSGTTGATAIPGRVAGAHDLPGAGGKPEGLAARASFDESLAARHSDPCKVEVLGELSAPEGAAEGAQGGALLLVRNGALEAWGEEQPLRPRWRHALAQQPSLGPTACAGEHALVCLGRQLLALDARTGLALWTRALPDDIESLAVRAGLALVCTRPASDALELFAFELARGALLWDWRTPSSDNWLAPQLGSGALVVPERGRGGRARALVLDLFRGVLRGELALPFVIDSDMHTAAWIDGGLWLLPHFFRSRAEDAELLSAFDLDRLRLAWTASASPGVELANVLRSGGAVYLLTSVAQPAKVAEAGALQQLDLDTGTLASIAPLRLGQRAVGLEPGTRVDLEAPYLFLLQEGAQRETPICMLHLPYGPRWIQRLPASADEIDLDAMPIPAVSETSVAIAWARRAESVGPGRELALFLVDAKNGAARDTRLLSAGLQRAPSLELYPMGSCLFLVGGAEHLEIWENRR